jgi:hypothetical protein
MLIKSQKNLVPTETIAHSVVIEDDMHNPIFVATHVADAIAYAAVGDADFKRVLKLAGVDNAPTVFELLPPK